MQNWNKTNIIKAIPYKKSQIKIRSFSPKKSLSPSSNKNKETHKIEINSALKN